MKPRAPSLVLAALVCSAPALAHINEYIKLVPSDLQPGDHFGRGVALAEDTAAVGAPLHDDVGTDSGAVYVFTRSGLVWSQQQKLVASDGSAQDRFGEHVAIHGDTLVVGAHKRDDNGTDSGAAYVFVRNGTTWSQEAKLLASDGSARDAFGFSVAVHGDLIVVGTFGHDGNGLDAGAAYVFARTGTTWTEEAILQDPTGAAGDFFGASVSVHEEIVVVGASKDDDAAVDGGGVHVFTHDGVAWSHETALFAPDAGQLDLFGISSAISEHRILVGAPRNDESGADAGASYVFDEVAGSWVFTTKYLGLAVGPGDWFGNSVALDHHLGLVGSRLFDFQASNSGQAFAFVEEGGNLDIEVLVPSDPSADDQFGVSLGASECWAVVGSYLDDDNGADSGSAYVYAVVHQPESYCTAGTSASGCQATLSGTGLASASAPTGFTVDAASVEGNKFGLFFFGTNGRQANSWGSGSSFQCVVPPVARGGVLSPTGTGNACDGAFAQDLNALWCPTCPKPAKNPGAGAVVQVQLWYRDPLNTSGQTTSLSDAIEFEVCP